MCQHYKSIVLFSYYLLTISPVYGQTVQLPSSYVPFTVSEADFKSMHEYLMNQPTKFSLPILQWLEQQSAAAKVKAAEKKPDEKVPE